MSAAKVHADMMRDPAMGGMMQHMHLTPLFTKVRFSLWDQVLAEPAPADDLRYTRAMWHAARGLAHAAQGRLKEAEAERTALAALKDDAALKTLYVSSVNTGASVVAIGYEVLSGEIAAKQKNAAQAAKHYAQAVALEDGLTYMEPPDWPIPVRQLQGAALLALGRLGGGRDGVPRRHEEVSRQRLVVVGPEGQASSGSAKRRKPPRSQRGSTRHGPGPTNRLKSGHIHHGSSHPT